ncbi:BglG family transcription antiterminator [Enterococcus sp. BWT-B8]|uniref:BglG family transcription antiterminator n=1 Tax=Enterococcus sp. BWT-B8 TaxID=2885157 RepID=UPI001E39C9A0|nr:BglG family transcription antiterminator [Enterococcus sp. BWT-B8]MCB5951445.1 BglG family transcription antiterminator [Enterococcus sp. BWT-B8]
MNRRINKIMLDALHEKKETLHNYAELFKVSDQTIRNDIKEINYYLEKSNQIKIIFDEDGYLQMADEVDLQELLKTYASFQNYHLSQDERRTILAMLLVTSCDYITTYYLSEYVLVSRNTLVSDIEELKIWFKRNGLVLHSYVGKGYKVQGNEAKIRYAMMKLIIFNGLFDNDYDYALGFENNIFQNLLLDIIDKDTRYQEIAQMLLESEKDQGLQLSDFSYQEVVCYLLIIVERLSLGFTIQNAEELSDVKESSKSSFAEAIAEKLKEMYSLAISEDERSYLISILRSKSYIKNNSRKIDSIETQILINEFIFNLSKDLNIKYYLNSDLFDLLENHLKLLIYRIKLKSNVKNGLFEEVYQAYADIFPLVKKHVKPIEEFLETEITQDEISFIVMYVMAILENNINNTFFKETIRVRVICNSGRGTAQLIEIKLKKAFPQIDIVSVDSSHILQKIQPENQDLIITTVPLQFDKSPVLLVNPLLTEDDIVAIQKVIYRFTPQEAEYDALPLKDRQLLQSCLPIIEKYVEEEYHQKFVSELEELYRLNQRKRRVETKEISRLSDVLTIDRVVLDKSAGDWREAVELAGKILLEDQLIEQRYIESMIQMIEEHDSYIVISPGVAIPHGEAANGAIQIGASFLRLKEPVRFNHKQNDPVKYVIALSIPEGKTIGTCLYYFTEILATETFILRMDACEQPEEVLIELKNMEDKVMGFSNEKNTM